MSMPEDFIARLDSLRQIMNQQYSKHDYVVGGSTSDLQLYKWDHAY